MKKFGKFLLFTAAASAAIAGAYYYLQKKSQLAEDYDFEDEDEDYDDFSEDLDATDSARSYVPLSKEGSSPEDTSEDDFAREGDFTSLAEQIQEKNNEQVEEFFDEEEA